MVRLSERGEIRVGFRCNARCGFCYYQDLLDNPVDKEPTTGEIRRRLTTLRRLGATEVEFTGGEPTIRPDLPELIGLAKALGFVNVSIITNGLRLAKPAYARKLIDAGANDFLFSIHGHDRALHDAHTAIPGSFDRIVAGVVNVREYGARCRGTTTVTAENHRHLADILALQLELGMACIHLAVFSPVAQAGGPSPNMIVSYADAAQSIKSAIDRHQGSLPPLSVKYIPFCFMAGYEQYVMNLYQQSFDPDDWNYYLSNRVRRAGGVVLGVLFDALANLGALGARRYRVLAGYGWRGAKVFGLTRLVELLRKRRPKACRRCRYDLVCDHVWRDYLHHFPDTQLNPVPGTKVSHPAWCYQLARYRVPGSPVIQTAGRTRGTTR